MCGIQHVTCLHLDDGQPTLAAREVVQECGLQTKPSKIIQRKGEGGILLLVEWGFYGLNELKMVVYESVSQQKLFLYSLEFISL